MADASFAESNTFHIASEDAVHSLVHRVFAPLRRHAKYKMLSRELHNLSDRELSDLGIARAQIRRIAQEGASQV